MPHTTKFENTLGEVTITSDEVIAVTDGDARALLDYLKTMKESMPSLETLEVIRDPLDLEHYTYTFEADDGRKWEQNLWVEPGRDLQDFRTTGFGNKVKAYASTEYPSHRLVRDRCISLIRSFGVIEIRCSW